jgi:6-phosphofructokinase 1
VEFKTPEGIQQQAVSVLKNNSIDRVVVIGGRGFQTGAAALAAQGIRVFGIALTIDNDLCETELLDRGCRYSA